MKELKTAFLLMGFVVLITIFNGCVETRQKDITTDGNGSADGVFSITQDAVLNLTGFTCSKTGCGSTLQMQITLMGKDSPKENVMFVTANQLNPGLTPINARFGDRLIFKITSGCPNAKYTVTFTLESNS
jgi:hypothetical protein